VARRRLREQLVQHLALIGVERAEHLVLGGGEPRFGLGQPRASVVCQRAALLNVQVKEWTVAERPR
jgi:hypothetical protein